MHAAVSSLHPHADVNALYSVAEDAKEAVAAAASSSSGGGGPFGFLADGFETVLSFLDARLESLHVPYSYGFAIIILTVLVKLGTLPLSKKSMESTIALQSMQPKVKELQAKYSGDPETLQVETARLYRDAGVNPLAGCLPTLATIPVFIGLYRALTKAADDGLLTDGFFWIPSLGGPTSLTARQAGMGSAWLFPLENGAPPIGWHDAIAYLVLPVLLVVSQFVSQKIISPQQDASQQQGANAVLKFLPLMIGYFSLNVPSGLTLYWLVNNILSTAQQLYLKNTMKVKMAPEAAAAVEASAPIAVGSLRPKEERVKKLSGKDAGSRKKRREDGESDDDVIDVEATSTQAPTSKQSRSDRGNKFRAIKAREAAMKAASKAQPQPQESSNGAGAAAQQQQEAGRTATATRDQSELRVPDAPPRKD